MPRAKALPLHALGHDTASVFHMMRAAEIGLRVLARERRVSATKKRPLDWNTWGNLIDKIEVTLGGIRKKPNGPKKDLALGFYSGALGHMTALKDVYRDQVNHVRRSYDEHESARVLDRTHDCLLLLSTRLNEDSTRAIGWGI